MSKEINWFVKLHVGVEHESQSSHMFGSVLHCAGGVRHFTSFMPGGYEFLINILIPNDAGSFLRVAI